MNNTKYEIVLYFYIIIKNSSKIVNYTIILTNTHSYNY